MQGGFPLVRVPWAQNMCHAHASFRIPQLDHPWLAQVSPNKFTPYTSDLPRANIPKVRAWRMLCHVFIFIISAYSVICSLIWPVWSEGNPISGIYAMSNSIVATLVSWSQTLLVSGRIKSCSLTKGLIIELQSTIFRSLGTVYPGAWGWLHYDKKPNMLVAMFISQSDQGVNKPIVANLFWSLQPIYSLPPSTLHTYCQRLRIGIL